MAAFYTHFLQLGKPAIIWPEPYATSVSVLLEDPITGLIVLTVLIAAVFVARIVLSPVLNRIQTPEPPLKPVLQALRDLDDEEMLAVGRKLGRLPARDRRVRAAAQPLASALLDWRSTFDDAARREFLDLASDLLSGYDPGRRTA